MKKNNLIVSILTVIIYAVLSKLLSFFVELVVAYRFGAIAETDVYYMIYGIMQIITPMITVGIWKVFMPAYKECQINGGEIKTKPLTDELIVIFSVVCFILVALLELFPNMIIRLFAPGFSNDTLLLAETLLRIMSPMLAFITIAVFHSAILQANQDFAKSQVKYIIQHIPPLICLTLVGSALSIKTLSLSLVLGEMLACFIAIFFTRNEYSFSFPKTNVSKETKQVLKLIPAACTNSIINQINHIVDKAFGSILSAGSLTFLTYGNKLVSFFDGIITTAFSTAFFPHMAELNVKKDENGLKNFLGQYILVLLCILIPATFLMSFYSKAIVKLVFGHGKFDDVAVNQTSVVLFIYSIGLLAMGFNTLFNDVFYIKKKTNVLVATNIINILINLFLDWFLVSRFEIIGLCLATTLSIYISIAIKWGFVKGYFGFEKKHIMQILHVLFGCIIACVIPVCVRYFLSIEIIYELFIGVISFIIVYGVILFHPGTEFHMIAKEFLIKKKKG